MSLKRTFKILLCFVSICALGLNLNAQTNEPCRESFVNAFNQFRDEGTGNYDFAYTTQTTLTSGETSKEEVEIKVKDARVYMRTGNNKVYKDESATVMIDEDRKLIFIIKTVSDSLTADRAKWSLMMQDSLVSNVSNFACRVEPLDGEPTTMITIGNGNAALSTAAFKELSYWVHKSGNGFRKIKASYKEGSSRIRDIEVIFDKYNKDFNGNAFSGSALSKIYKSVGQVRETYASYRVVNNLID